MKSPDKDKITCVTEIYATVFPVRFKSDELAEVILAGLKKNPDRPDMSQVRATVETHINAVPDLVALSDEIIDNQEEISSYRLLKFDKNGIHMLNPDDFRVRSDHGARKEAYVSVGRPGVC